MPARVLVVDDTPLNVKLLTVKLEYEDYVVSTAADGFEALAKIEAEKPDIVLLDVLMPPGIDGFETCRRIRADPATAHIPVVMVTALQDVDELVRGFEAGADDFLTIPVNSVVLMARIRSQLRQKRYYESLLEQSMIDPLTGAFNCRYLEAHVPRLIARCRAANKPIAVMMIDIDHFKRINDEHGHAAGNHVLKEIANRITSALRPSDLVARVGGEEFAVVMGKPTSTRGTGSPNDCAAASPARWSRTSPSRSASARRWYTRKESWTPRSGGPTPRFMRPREPAATG